MENLNKDLFRVVGKSIDKMDSISRPNLSFLAGCLEKTEEEPGGFHRIMYYYSVWTAGNFRSDVQPVQLYTDGCKHDECRSQCGTLAGY